MSLDGVKKTTNLFGDETFVLATKTKKKPKSLFDDYEGFVDKFKDKKTTDDCYTPTEVFDCVLRYFDEVVGINDRKIVRPFFPGNDYQLVEYPADCIVIDNPPFSIISEICRWYISNGVKYFLFAPHLTLFSSDIDHTAVVCGGSVVYENGATVKTSFVTNMLGDIKILGAPHLFRELSNINDRKAVALPKYKYPPNVLTVSMVSQIVERGVDVQFNKSDLVFVRGLDDQKKHKKAIFGSGFLLSEKAAAEKAAAEKAAAEKASAEKASAEKEDCIEWKISGREREMINQLK